MIPPGQGPPLHTHANEAEAWWVIEGELRFKLGEKISAAPTGSFVFVPPGTPHCFDNPGEVAARILVLFAPAGMERFFEEFAEVPADQVGPAAFETAGRPVEMEVVGPPLAQSDPL